MNDLDEIRNIIEKTNTGDDVDTASIQLMYLSRAVNLIENTEIKSICHEYICNITDVLVHLNDDYIELLYNQPIFETWT